MEEEEVGREYIPRGQCHKSCNGRNRAALQKGRGGGDGGGGGPEQKP